MIVADTATAAANSVPADAHSVMAAPTTTGFYDTRHTPVMLMIVTAAMFVLPLLTYSYVDTVILPPTNVEAHYRGAISSGAAIIVVTILAIGFVIFTHRGDGELIRTHYLRETLCIAIPVAFALLFSPGTAIDTAAVLLTAAAITCSGLFAGAAFALSYFVFPALVTASDKRAVNFFADTFPSAAKFQPAMTTIALGASVVRLLLGTTTTLQTIAHAVNAVTAAASIVYTLIFILPINKSLLVAARTHPFTADETIRPTLLSWGSRHDVRTFCWTSSFLLLILGECIRNTQAKS